MTRRATITDVAEASGVSVATVNRVLSGSPAVREETGTRVREAAELLGFRAAGLIRSRLQERLPAARVGILLQRPEEAFYREFTGRLEKAVRETALFRGSAFFDYARSLDGEEIAARLLKLAGRAEAVALVAPEHPTLTRAVEELRARSIPVFTLLSDCAPAARTAYIGVDNRRAGRTAGWAIAQCAARPGRVAVFVGSHRFHGHELREIGLRSYFREHAPGFTVLETAVNDESPERTEALVSSLAAAGGLVGCYLAGGGTAGAVAAARALPPEARPVIVSNDAPSVARAALNERLLTLTVAEPLDAICRELTQGIARALEKPPAAAPGQIFLPFDLFTPENI